MKKITCFLIAMSLLGSMPVVARIDESSIISDGLIEYEGQAAGAERVSITVLKSGCTIDEFMESASPEDMLVEYAQTTADADGNYSFDINPGGISGTYRIWVGYDKEKSFTQDEVKYINLTKNTDALAAIGQENADVAEILSVSSADLGADSILTDVADDEDYKNAAAILKASADSSVYADKIKTSESIDKALAIALINAGKLSLNETADLLMTSETVNKWYNESFMTDKIREYITARIDKSSDTFEKFDKAFAEATALGVIYGANGYGSVTSYLKENADILGISKSKVSDAFSKSVIGKQFDKFLDIGIENFKVDTNTNNNSGFGVESGNSGGGGNGGGSPAGGKTVAVNNTETPTPITDKEATSLQKSFSDMSGFEWALEAVNTLAEKNIVSGKSEGIFAPSDMVLREEFVKMIMGAGEFEEIYGDIAFEDVTTDDWFYPYVKNAYLCGIVNGFSESRFGSGKNILRQDMAVICYNMLKAKGVFNGTETTPELSYTDSGDISDYAVEAVKILSDKKILTGDDNNRFLPQNNANRAEAAQMIYKTYMLISQYES